MVNTPRSPFGSLSNNHRFKGYPGSNFDSPRHKQASIDNDLFSSKFGHHEWLDTVHPKIYGGHGGIQYGSESLPTNVQKARPLKNIKMDDDSRLSADIQGYQKRRDKIAEDIQRMKQVRIQQLMDRETEKRKDLEQLKAYNPWGKPGAGAPMSNDSEDVHKKMKLFEEHGNNQYAVDSNNGFYHQFGKPGAGAPIRTKSGALDPHLKIDPSIRFQRDCHHIIDKEVRYKDSFDNKEKLNQDLAKQVEEKKAQSFHQQQAQIQAEQEMASYDPFGKPGAGAPMNKNNAQLARRFSLGKENKNLKNQSEKYDPWGKGAGNAFRDTNGDIRRFRHSDPNLGVQTEHTEEERMNGLSIELGKSVGGGAPNRTDSGSIQVTHRASLVKAGRGENNTSREVNTNYQTNEIYYPFGKSGCGAPLWDDDGNVKAYRTQEINKCILPDYFDTPRTQNKKIYHDELDKLYKAQVAKRDAIEKEIREPATDLASMISKGLVGKPRSQNGLVENHPLFQSDVTKMCKDIRSHKHDWSHAYSTQLDEQAEERQRSKQLENVMSKQAELNHMHTMERSWGKQGHGAPMVDGAKKRNLNTILHYPQVSQQTNGYLMTPFASGAY